jgi:hypothetical protein
MYAAGGKKAGQPEKRKKDSEDDCDFCHARPPSCVTGTPGV